jgi:SecD/SecF fusion protein
MNKKPVMLRLIFVLVVIAVFGVSMYPLYQRDIYSTFESMLKEKDATVENVIKNARTAQEKDANLYPSRALQQSADSMGVDLTKYINGKNISNNSDVISQVMRQASGSIRLGLDLNGGVEFILKLVEDERGSFGEGEKGRKELSSDFETYRDQAIEILRKRMETQNIYESEISPFGTQFISLRAPIVAKDEKLKLEKLIRMSASLEFRLVSEDNDRLVREYLADPQGFIPPVGYQYMTYTDVDSKGTPTVRHFFVEIKPQMTGDNIVEAFPQTDQFGQRKILLRFNRAGGQEFGEVTKNNVGRLLAIVLDGQLYSAPRINGAITDGAAEITGNFSREEAESISNALVSGSIPVKIDVEAVFDTDPTLGKENIQSGIHAGIIALIAVMVFMFIYYRRAGLIADLALAVNVILVLGAMATFSATLTLPGIAGIILTIGMAVDANVLIFERIREELAKGKGLASAIDLGYSKAFSTILDANVTTLITALILVYLGTGPVKGFAVTLSIGIATSMFTALFMTRLVFDLLGRIFNFKEMKFAAWFCFKQSFDFLGKSKLALTVSAVLMILSLVVIGIRGRSLLGVDFTGGTEISMNYTENIPQQDIADVLVGAGFKEPKVNYKTSMDETDRKLAILIREKDMGELTRNTEQSPKEVIIGILNKAFPQANYKEGSETSVGGLIGMEFTKSAILAIFLAILGIVIYVSIRFEFAFAIAGIVALAHDVLIAIGIFASIGLFFGGREITLPVIAALLTIIGYSLNDTIVVFDRIREDLGLEKGTGFKQIINLSINQTLSRTLLTSLTTALVLVVLLISGGVAINDFVLVMLIGVIVGTYSSVFVASPIVSVWHKRIGKNVQ